MARNILVGKCRIGALGSGPKGFSAYLGVRTSAGLLQRCFQYYTTEAECETAVREWIAAHRRQTRLLGEVYFA